MKDQKGITLIALVITIIVLLILAGISIAMLTGDEGILTKASDSTVENDIGSAKDQVAMEANTALEEYYDAKYVSNTLGDGMTAQKFVANKLATKFTESGSKNIIGEAKITVTNGEEEYKVEIAPKTTNARVKTVTATITANGGLDGWE